MILVFLAFALIASASIANKIILKAMPLALFTGLRMFIASIILLSWFGARHKRLRASRFKHDIIPMMLLAIGTTFVPSIMKGYALREMPAAKALLFGSLDPFFTAIYAYLLFSEKLSLRKWLGIALGMYGVLTMAGSTSELEQMFAGFSLLSKPELAALAVTLISRFGWINVQRVLRKEVFVPGEVNGLLSLFGGIFCLITAWYFGEWSWFGTSIDMSFVGLFAYTVIVGNVAAYTLYSTVLKQYPVIFVSLAGASVPIFAAFFAWLTLAEPLSMRFFYAIGLNFAGLYLFHRA